MKKHAIAAALLGSVLCASAFAQQVSEGPWMVRARAVHLNSSNGDSTPLDLSINDKWLPEVDISYFINPNVAVELILTVPQKQTLSAGGLAIGSFKHLPPTLTAQYHFTNFGGFKPYVGAGVNYTRISSVNLPAGVTVDRNSFGPALQVGVDIPVAKNMYLNFDIKKVYIRTDVAAGGSKIGTFKVDPVLVGVGLGWRF
ncbi:MAG: OmpW family protein [Giesbergeria sp.]|nr:OmpW family protein [Giesbergeria sp.]MBP6419099.1 OmpW family protein [Giesbergeria sp.]